MQIWEYLHATRSSILTVELQAKKDRTDPVAKRPCTTPLCWQVALGMLGAWFPSAACCCHRSANWQRAARVAPPVCGAATPQPGRFGGGTNWRAGCCRARRTPAAAPSLSGARVRRRVSPLRECGLRAAGMGGGAARSAFAEFSCLLNSSSCSRPSRALSSVGLL